jgi:hypothetical protein
LNERQAVRLANVGKKLCLLDEKSSIFNWALKMDTNIGVLKTMPPDAAVIAPTNQKTSLSGTHSGNEA